MSNNEMQRERIAIIGIGLTLPGGAIDPASYWKLLSDKTDATVDIPADRWDLRRFYSPYGSEKPGKMYARRGGFLQGNIWEFDPLFFGISPREASVIDVQQRLLLEVATKAFQDAGVTDEQYEQSKTGVFIGAFCMDASVEAASIYNRNWYITQSVTGSTATLLSNRLSYVFNLKGPSLTVDTACSSSLVATHYAVQSILAGECDTALVGGVNIMTQPEHFMEMCKGRLLSKDGRCFTWDKRANGYARGEGAGMLLLKPLSKALRDKDHIYAVIETSGVNQDGTTKGISLPNPEAQADLIRSVLKKAGLTPDHIDYVEAHGTGTQAGDKAETSALNNVFAAGRQDKLHIGSVKTNIGHLEAAAGVSGLIKAALSIRYGKIPANLNFETPNPEIPFDTMCLKVSTDMQDWPKRGEKRYAGINAFGYGGTNAHVIISQAPDIATVDGADNSDSGPLLLPLSAKSKESLKSLARQYKVFLEEERTSIAQFLRRVSTKRTHYERRALVQANNKSELLERLQKFADGTQTEGVSYVENPSGADKLVFVYSGMGPQWWAMGRELLATEPLFAREVEKYDRVFQRISGWSLLKEMQATEAESRMARTEVAQPANFAIQAGLTELWRSWGIVPSAILGHSVGEVTAAYVSGILSLEDALLVSYHRSRLQGTLAGTGGMLAVGLSEKDVQAYLREYGDLVSIAANNSPHAVTLAGNEAALRELADIFQHEGIFQRALQVEVPYHSPLMGPLEADILDCLRSIRPQPATIPCYSTVTGLRAQNDDFGTVYWWHNVRETVQFARTIETLCAEGYRSFLEVGPHPVLGNSIKEILTEQNLSGQVYSSLNRKTPEQATLLHSLGMLYAQGYRPNWEEMQKGEDQYFALPVYPWDRKHYDNASPKFQQDKFGEGGHPILYRNLHLPHPTWEVELGDAMFPYMKDHRIGDKTVVPGAFYVEAALALQEKFSGEKTGGLRNLAFERFLALADEMEEQEKRVVSTYSPEDQSFKIYSTTTAREETWEFHARGEFITLPPLDRNLDVLDQDLSSYRSYDIDDFYKAIASTGLQYGPYFQPIKCLKVHGNSVYAEIDNTLAHEAHYILPPTVLDSMFQTLLVFGGQYSVPFVPVKIDRLSVHGRVTQRTKVLGKLLWISAKSLKADFMLFDENDDPIVEIKGVTCQALPQFASGDAQDDTTMYRTLWTRLDSEQLEAASPSAKTVLVVSDCPQSGELLSTVIAEKVKVVSIAADSWTAAEFARLVRAEDVGTIVYHAHWHVSQEQALDASIAHCTRLTEIAQTLDQEHPDATLRVIVLTRAACMVDDGDTANGFSQFALTGLARTINTEYPHLQCTTVDLVHGTAEEMALVRDTVIVSDIGIQELAIRSQGVYRHGLVRHEPDAEESQAEESQAGQRVVITDLTTAATSAHPYTVTSRVLSPNCPPTACMSVLGEDEIEIEIDYLILSQFDLLNSQLTVYPNDPSRHYFRYQAGMQCVGTIVKKGRAVAQLALGDRVLSLYPNGVSNYSVVPAERVIPVPHELTKFALPDMYESLRARYAMNTLGNCDHGAHVLVKGRWGAFAQTVLSDAYAHGMRAIFVDEDSSSQAREEATSYPGTHYLAAEGGRWKDKLANIVDGVDVFINHGWQDIEDLPVLKPFGRVIDFRSSQSPHGHGAMVLPKSNGIYQSIDIDEVFRDHFNIVRECLKALMQDLVQGRLNLTVVPFYRLRDISSAVRALKEHAHSAVRLQAKGEAVPLLKDTIVKSLEWDGSYIVTGGTRGFGLQCARWLVQKGARNLVLMSRSGAAGSEAENAIREMRELGVTVKVCALDIADGTRLREELGSILHSLPPVRGVIHSAMVLDDGFIGQMNEARYRKVMTPKIQGAINLARELDLSALRFLLMFSSISSLIGNSGQANYVAANSFLDGYAHHLAGRGIHAKAINWGALSDTGVLAKDADLIKVLEMAGIHGISNKQAMKTLEIALQDQSCQTGIFHVDWKQWASANSSQSKSSFYQELLDQQENESENEKLLEILNAIVDSGPEERRTYVQRELAVRFGEIFKMSPDEINVHASIIDLGVDSLIAAEITMALRTQLGVEIPLIEMLSGPSIVNLAEKILTQIEALIDEASSEDAFFSDDTSSIEKEAMSVD